MREFADLFIDLRTASRTQLTVRVATMLGAVLFLASYALAGGGTLLAWAGIFGLGALVVVQPHALAPGLFLTFAVASWWATVDAGWHWALLPAALGLLLVHSGAALCASVPAQAPLPRSVLRRWAGRGAVVALITVAIWGVAGLLTPRPGTDLGTIPGMLGLAVLAAGLLLYVRRRGARSTE